MPEDPRSDRDWEHWPGRKPGDDGIRHRLRALFSATDGDALEARIEEKGREIEEHTDQLQATISDLERRETRTTQLRSAVEEMLRLGSAELDERHAGLTQLSLELASREENVRADERDIAVRKQELGAVELRRAAVERREAQVSAREAELDRIAANLTELEQMLVDRERAASALVPFPGASSPKASHVSAPPVNNLLFVTAPTYRMIEQPGPAVAAGAVLEIDGTAFVVARVGRSPRIGDHRCWAYLEPVETSEAH